MVVVGLIILLLCWLIGLPSIICTLGWFLLVVGLILWLLGAFTSFRLGGRRHWW